MIFWTFSQTQNDFFKKPTKKIDKRNSRKVIMKILAKNIKQTLDKQGKMTTQGGKHTKVKWSKKKWL